jgi:hypothetical protein
VTSGDIKEKRIEGNIIVQGSASFWGLTNFT